jgi:HeH/LEM domain
MSRSMTAAQVIALGEYLDPEFDPSSLTVNQLLGVFGFHNIRYPTPYTKPKLVQLFNDEIKPKMKQLKKDKVKKENSLASDNGIKDGVTGRFLNEDSNKVCTSCLVACMLVDSCYAQPPRRSSRRGSRAPSSEVESKAEAVSRVMSRQSRVLCSRTHSSPSLSAEGLPSLHLVFPPHAPVSWFSPSL